MTWIKSFKVAIPLWIVAIGAAGASMFLTNFAADVGFEEAFERLLLAAFALLPLMAFVVKATSADIGRFRAAFPKKVSRDGDHDQ